MVAKEEKNIFDPETVLPKFKQLLYWIRDFFSKPKRVVLGLLVIILSLVVINSLFLKKKSGNKTGEDKKSLTVVINRSFEFPALTNQGKPTNNKIKLAIASAEKTNKVLVNDKVFTAKNKKLFLIINLELKNSLTQPLNILPGDLVRLTYNGDEENKFAPDLHNNLVGVAAISTKLDRVGFVIPEAARDFKLYVGELEGKKEEISVNFPS